MSSVSIPVTASHKQVAQLANPLQSRRLSPGPQSRMDLQFGFNFTSSPGRFQVQSKASGNISDESADALIALRPSDLRPQEPFGDTERVLGDSNAYAWLR